MCKGFFVNNKANLNLRHIILGTITLLYCMQILAQCPTKEGFLSDLSLIEKNAYLGNSQKLKEIYKLKKVWDQCNLSTDSVYATILLKIGVYEFRTNKNYETSIQYTLKAVSANSFSKNGSSLGVGVKCYFNLAYYHQALTLFNKALAYFDSTIALAQTFRDTGYYVLDSRLYKSNIYFQKGDYQKGIDEGSIGVIYSLKKKDTTYFLAFLNQRAQCLFYQGQIRQSLSDIETIISLSKRLKEPFQLASAYKIKGLIYAKNRQFNDAEPVLKQAIQTRMLTSDYSEIAKDYNDLGNFYMDSLQRNREAKKCYIKALEYVAKNNDSILLARINSNIGLANFYEGNLEEASVSNLRALSFLKANTSNNLLINTSAARLNLISQKELVLGIMSNKTNLLLHLFKKLNDKKYLSACLETAMVTDSLINQMRHEQVAEGTKLYWRNRTREFFTNAMEACYMAGDINRAFFFMERSRAVLLNDQLNELGAAAFLPGHEAATEQNLHVSIIKEQQLLNDLKDSSAEYFNQQEKLLHSKDRFEHYIKSIEQKYPNYYQYKYSDDVIALEDLRKYLSANHQTFVYYLMNDTVTYILSLTASGSTFNKLSKNEFDSQLPAKFLEFCSDKSWLNKNYHAFISLSNTLYRLLFEPLKIARGRVIICPDNFLLPFEAMCPDNSGERFLVHDYSFSYVYSARYLLKKYNSIKTKGDFIGFAPVTFQPYQKIANLKQSAASLQQIGSYYKNPQLFVNEEASRHNFISSVSGYKVVNVFSHASALKTDVEPMLFMADSTVKLSELQTLRNPSIELVVLSACETNVGKNATGEGVYSLARGFAAAGVPTIAATLWNAEEGPTYMISEKFHENLSQGMSKDEALQKAKLFFMQSSDNENLLPYYWANMILMGNAEPVQFSLKPGGFPWMVAALIAIVIISLFIFLKSYKLGNSFFSKR